MATLSSELFFSLFLFSIFSFSIPTTASICPPSRCLSGPPIRFPFRLRNRQPPRCGYNSYFDLSCNNQSFLSTVLTLPVRNDYLVVERIDYEFQTIYVNDPNLCLPRRFLDQTLDLNGTPFRLGSSQNFTFLNCSTQALLAQTSFPVVTTSISCLSTENHTVFAVPSFAYENWFRKTSSPPPSAPSSPELSCSVISSVFVPRAASHELQDMFGNLGGGLGLTWSTPDCGDCEANGGDCGFDGDTNRIVCSGIPTAKRNVSGLPRTAKYGIIIGVGIPGILCILGLASFIWGRIHAHGRGHQPTIDLSTTTYRQPAILIAGLDGPTIESYPKTLLGESKRLPKPNDNTCSICLCEYQPTEVLRTIPECNHYFHAGCIDEWLKLNATCPMCRNSPDRSSLVSVTPSSSSTSSSTTSSASS